MNDKIGIEEIIKFCLSDTIDYVPMTLNSNCFLKGISAGDPTVSRDLIDLLPSLPEEKGYLIDLSDCEGKNVELSKDSVEKLKDNNSGLLCGESVKMIVSNYGSDYETIPIGEGGNTYLLLPPKGAYNDAMNKIVNRIGNNNIKNFFYNQILCKFFYEDIEKNGYSFEKGKYKYLESSNVYVNTFINIRSLFLSCSHLQLVIERMTEFINEDKSLPQDAILLGVSNTGIILASLLGMKTGKKVESLNQIGPVYCLDKCRGKIDRFKNEKYILISDVICLGGELKVTKGILDMAGAQLLKAICVVKIRDVYRQKKSNIIPIISVVDDFSQILISGEKIDYQVFCDNE